MVFGTEVLRQPGGKRIEGASNCDDKIRDGVVFCCAVKAEYPHISRRGRNFPLSVRLLTLQWSQSTPNVIFADPALDVQGQRFEQTQRGLTAGV